MNRASTRWVSAGAWRSEAAFQRHEPVHHRQRHDEVADAQRRAKTLLKVPR